MNFVPLIKERFGKYFQPLKLKLEFMMKLSNKVPTRSLNLLQKLIVAKEIYRTLIKSVTDNLIKTELRRITIEKEIFIRDFNAISGFRVRDFIDQYSEDIRVETNNLKLKFDNLILEHDDAKILSGIIEREKEHKDQYHLVLEKPVDDEFIHMILKNQLDETNQSLRELKDILETLIAENS